MTDEIRNKDAEEMVSSRREFVKKAGYTAPVILTLAMTPSFAAAGSASPTTGGGGWPWRPGRQWGRRRGQNGWWRRRRNGQWVRWRPWRF